MIKQNKKEIYVSEEDKNELKKKYSGMWGAIKKEIENHEENFNKHPDWAFKKDYRVYLETIKEEIYFQNPVKETYKEYLDTTKIKNKHLKILEDVNLFEKITVDELDKKIVREIPARKTIFLCSNGRLVINSQIASYNLLINDEAGTGKDYVTSKTLDIIPNEQYIKKTRISPTVFTYWHNSKFEPEWTWDGKVFYTEDISEGVLNSEVFKVMCSSGSEATIVKNQRAIEISIDGKPVIITTTANSTPNAELTRRFEIVNLDESVNQTREIMKRHCEYAKKGLSPELDLDIKKALSHLKRLRVVIPYADSLYLLFPPESVMMRTKFPRFLDLIKSSAVLHQFQRKWKSPDIIVAEKQDYEIATEIMEKIASNKYMVSLTRNQRRIMEFLEKKTDEDEDFVVSATKLRSMMGNFLSVPAMYKNLSQLASYGLIKTELKEDGGGRETEYYYLSEIVSNGIHKITFPKFEEILRKNGQK